MVAFLKLPMRIAADEGADRRVFARKACNQDVEGLRTDHALPALRQSKLTLHLRDLSAGGLSAISAMPLQRNERIRVSFPQQGLGGGWDAVARVVRCEPSAMGYRVAMEFDMLAAA